MRQGDDGAEATLAELDAIELLMQDHREVEYLFREYEYLQTRHEDAARVVEIACAELKVYDELKTEVFCRAVLDATREAPVESLMARFASGQRAIRDLIMQIEQTDNDHDQRDAHFSALAEHVQHHFLEAESQVFPMAKKLKRLDLVSVAGKMRARRLKIVSEN